MIGRERVIPLLLEACPSFEQPWAVDPERFRRYLQPESSRWWDELDRFWAGQSPYVGAGLKKRD